MMAKVVIYTTGYCPYCFRAKDLLEQKGIAYTEIAVDNAPDKRAEMMRLSGRHTVPQIFIDQHPIGGCDDLYALNRRGDLDKLLKGS